MHKLLAVCFLLSGFFCRVQAQEPVLVQVTGFVMLNDSVSVPYATVHNPKNNMITLTNGYGYFSILMASTDTLEIVSIGYERTKFSLPPGHQSFTYQTVILLKRMVYMLPSVKIGVINWAQFENEFNKIPLVENDLFGENMALVAREAAPKKTNFGYTIKGPISFLYGKFSKKAREMEKLEELMAENNTLAQANKKLTYELINEVTGLTKEDIDEFLGFCNIDQNFAARSSLYDLMVAIKGCYNYYEKSKPYMEKRDEIHQEKAVDPGDK